LFGALTKKFSSSGSLSTLAGVLTKKFTFSEAALRLWSFFSDKYADAEENG